MKKIRNSVNDAQILIDFDAQEEQELHENQEAHEISDQKERLTDLPVVEHPNETDENKTAEHSNSGINSKTDDAETVIETALETVITPESVPEQASASSPEESPSEDLLLSEEVETNGGNIDNGTNNKADNNDALDTFDPLVCVQNADKIPNDMLDTARYFLYRTGRDPRTINEKEIQAMREVFAKHYPARIQKEIDVACRRFVKNGKSLKMLFFGYIAAALRKQQSLVPFEKKLAKQGEDGNIKASSGQTTQIGCASYATCTGDNNRYLTSEDISNKTNPLSNMSMEELLVLEKELDGKMKKS